MIVSVCLCIKSHSVFGVESQSSMLAKFEVGSVKYRLNADFTLNTDHNFNSNQLKCEKNKKIE